MLRFCLWAALLLLPFLAAADPDRAAVSDRSLAVTDIAGTAHRPFDLGAGHGALLFFVTHDCPISNHYAREIRRICEEYAGRRIACYLVYVDPALDTAAIEKHMAAYGHHGYPAILDAEHALVLATGAGVTPEAVLLGDTGAILYRGRIDNFYAAWGRTRRHVTERDLRDALEALTSGRPIGVARTKALGCFIPSLEVYRER